jgi:hypothetical protein
MLDRSKGRVQMTGSPRSSILGTGGGDNNSTTETFPVTNHGGGQDPHMVVSTVKEKNLSLLFLISFFQF